MLVVDGAADHGAEKCSCWLNKACSLTGAGSVLSDGSRKLAS